ncbi:MAG: chemotaxis protein CheW [Acidobacteria bacterium]|nr:chemotaxis protein CheW [Acidobacteriota bacterium]
MKPEPQPFLVVRAGRLLCAIELSQIGEVLRPLAMSTIRGALPAVAGLAVVRGRSVPVLDLRRLLSEDSPPPPSRWVTLRSPGPLAVAVDGVEEVRWLQPDELDEAPLLSESAAGTLTRIGALDRDILLHFEGARILPLLEGTATGGGEASA